jgi:anti-anti-sigma regulatory factor
MPMTAAGDASTSGRAGDWLHIHSSEPHTAVIEATGGIDVDRAEQLWDAIEHALEISPGSRVVVDLTRISTFDEPSIHELAISTRAAARRKDDLRLVVDAESALGRHLHASERARGWPIYLTITDAFR